MTFQSNLSSNVEITLASPYQKLKRKTPWKGLLKSVVFIYLDVLLDDVLDTKHSFQDQKSPRF